MSDGTSLNAKLASMMPMAYGEPNTIDVDPIPDNDTTVSVEIHPAENSYFYGWTHNSQYGPQVIGDVAGKAFNGTYKAGAFADGGLTLGAVSDTDLSSSTQSAIIRIMAGPPN